VPLEQRPTFWRAAAALIAGVALAGCTSAPPRSQFPDADAALERLHAGFACVVGVQGTSKVDLVTQRGRVKGEVLLFAVNPSSVRFDVVSPFGAMIYTLTADGKDYKLADLEQKTFFYGPADTCNLQRFTQVPVPPHALVSLLRGEAPVLTHTKEDASLSWESDGYYKLVIQSKHQATEEIHLTVVPEDFDKEWSQQRVRLTYLKVSQAGVGLYEARIKDHEKAVTANPRVDEEGLEPDVPPSGPACSAELPRTIRLLVPETEDDVIFEYKDAKWNPPLIDGTFTQPVPGGMRQQYTSCDGEIPPAAKAPEAPPPAETLAD
jgi:outer membrane lipoprotein-sorting protein